MGVHDAPHCKTAVGVKNVRCSERELLLIEGRSVAVAFCVDCGSSPLMRARGGKCTGKHANSKCTFFCKKVFFWILCVGEIVIPRPS